MPPRECFVIMPIRSGEEYDTFRNRYEKIIQKAVHSVKVDRKPAFQCIRADDVRKPGVITEDVLQRLHRADVVIADLTDLNPNVFYELGVRHALRSGTILVASREMSGRLPFDISMLRVIFYDDRIGRERPAIKAIREVLLNLLRDDSHIDSPVLTAIPELMDARPRRIPGDPRAVVVALPAGQQRSAIRSIVRETAAGAGLAVAAEPAAGLPSIVRAGLVVADLTGRDQSVMYALGMAASMGKAVVLMAQSIDDVPPDLRRHRVVLYDPHASALEKLRARLSDAFGEHLSRNAQIC